MKTEFIKWMKTELEAAKPIKGSHKLSESTEFIKGMKYTYRRCINKANKLKQHRHNRQSICYLYTYI